VLQGWTTESYTPWGHPFQTTMIVQVDLRSLYGQAPRAEVQSIPCSF
jgi:hypothetical protein